MALRSVELLISGVGQWSQFWGIYSANEVWLLAASDDRHPTRPGQTDKQWTNELLAMCNGQNGKMEGQRGLTSGLSTGLDSPLSHRSRPALSCAKLPFLHDTSAVMHSSDPPPCPPCLPCHIASNWRNIHPHQPLPRDPSCHLFCPRATMRQKSAT
jgi:hypothetical protein